MALLSPGLEIQVSDESTYLPTAQSTVPLILLATASNKLFNNTVTSGTIDANAGKLDSVTSQRELISKYGVPTFQTGSLGTMLHGDERNEYGLLAAYSALGLGNQAYIVRANVDLDALAPSEARPTGSPSNGTYWFNIATDGTDWGIFEWNAATNAYTKKTPLLITEENLSGAVPNNSYGSVGSYGVVLRTDTSEVKYYYKGLDLTGAAVWVELGSDSWKLVHPALVGSVANPDLSSYANRGISINGVSISLDSAAVNDGGVTLDDLVFQIEAVAATTGVRARNLNGRLALYVVDTARSDGVVRDAICLIADSDPVFPLLQYVGITGSANAGSFVVGQTYQITDLGTTSQPSWNIIAGTTGKTYAIGDIFVAATSGAASPQTTGSALIGFSGPATSVGTYASVPTFLGVKPTGSVWFKTSDTGDGLNIAVEQYSTNSAQWNPVTVRVYNDEVAAIYGLDPSSGGINIPVGSLYAAADLDANGRANFQLYRRVASGATSISSSTTPAFTSGHMFSIGTTAPGSSDYVSYTIKITTSGSNTAALNSFISDVLSANIPNIDCVLNTNGSITISHTAGGLIHLTDISGTPILTAGFAANAIDTDAPLPGGLISNPYSLDDIDLFNQGIITTSGTSIAMATGSKVFTVGAGLGLVPNQGQSVKIVSNADSTKYMLGEVTAYTGTSLTVDVRVTTSADTIASWTISTAAVNYTVGSNRPATPAAHDKWFDTDTGIEYIYGVKVGANDSTWTVVGSSTANNAVNNRFYTSASAPGSPSNGDKWYHSTLNKVYVYKDAKWVEVWSRGDRSGYTASNFEAATYTFSASQPVTDPANNTMWYYSDAASVDIMINTASGWRGYRNVVADTRGYNLTNTDPEGVIISPTEPTTQSDGTTALAAGDLWLDSGDLVNYPLLYRYDGTDWVLIDLADQTSSNGILFTDARWGGSGSIDPSMDELPTVASLLTSDYIDLDCKDYRLYPRGMLLFNTRRSGFTVKQYRTNYFNAISFPNETLPAQKDCWVTVSGLKSNGSMYAGPQAQRNMIVQAMAAAIDSNLSVREDQYEFNVIACPGYPELLPNLVKLNNDRVNTAFVVGDTPMTLSPDSTGIIAWSNSLTETLGTSTEYVGVFYPAGRTTDLSGNIVVVPPSHMALRTIMRSDNVSFPWFAPAGSRRGIIDNASSIGYIDQSNGNEFVTFGLGRSLRDTLYNNRINPITVIPGTGLLLYGQKTRYGASSALDRINVVRLIAYIRRALSPIANSFLFEPNDKVTRDQIKQAVEGLMNDLVAKRGIYDYIVVCDDTNNTPDVISRNELKLDLALAPVRAVEFIYIPLRIRNPGEL